MIKLLEQAICGTVPSELPVEFQYLFKLYQAKSYEECYRLAVTIFGNSSDLSSREFMLHFICVILEIQYKLEIRAQWMNKWPMLISKGNSEFAISAYRYHSAVTCYFESYYSEANSRFQDLVRSDIAPLRFKALASYHLGLVARDRKLNRIAISEFKLALKLAQRISHSSLVHRVTRQLTLLSKEIDRPLLDLEISELLSEGLIREARRAYLRKRSNEVKEGLDRERVALHSFLPIFAFFAGRRELGLSLIERIVDPTIKLQVLSFMRELGLVPQELQLLESLISEDLGVSRVNNELAASDDVTKLQSLLNDLPSLTKEEICKQVWNLDYDPVIHDGKIYKLIHKLRDHIGNKDYLVNRYGRYEINKRYRV